MGASKVLLRRAACVLAAAMACGGAATAPAEVQAQMLKKAPDASAIRSAGPQAGKQRAALKKKAQPSRQARSGSKRSPVPTQRPRKAPLTAKTATGKAAPVAKAGSMASIPPPVARTLPPLGPERFYPNGIPELHPAFLHPLPGTLVLSEQAAASRLPGAEPEWLP